MSKFEMDLNEMEKLVNYYTSIESEVARASELMSKVTNTLTESFQQGTTKDTLLGDTAGLARYAIKLSDYAATIRLLRTYTQKALATQIDMDKINAKRVFEGIPASNMSSEIKQWVHDNPSEASQTIYQKVKEERGKNK